MFGNTPPRASRACCYADEAALLIGVIGCLRKKYKDTGKFPFYSLFFFFLPLFSIPSILPPRFPPRHPYNHPHRYHDHHYDRNEPWPGSRCRNARSFLSTVLHVQPLRAYVAEIERVR